MMTQPDSSLVKPLMRGLGSALRVACLGACLGACLVCPAAGVEDDAKGKAVSASGAGEMIRSAVVPDASGAAQPEDEAKAAAAPVPVPPLSHYAALWERSMFTTHDLPAPEVPQGPGFADQLVLAGMYEVDGAVVAVILDKMTASVTEARFGSDNELGVRIKAVEEGTGGSGARVQLQKGMQSGWVTFAEIPTAPPAAAAGGAAGNAAGGLGPRPLVPGRPGGEPAPAMNGAVAPAPGVLSPLPGMGVPPAGAAAGGMPEPAAGAEASPLPVGVPGPGAAGPNPALEEIPLPPP